MHGQYNTPLHGAHDTAITNRFSPYRPQGGISRDVWHWRETPTNSSTDKPEIRKRRSKSACTSPTAEPSCADPPQFHYESTAGGPVPEPDSNHEVTQRPTTTNQTAEPSCTTRATSMSLSKAATCPQHARTTSRPIHPDPSPRCHVTL